MSEPHILQLREDRISRRHAEAAALHRRLNGRHAPARRYGPASRPGGWVRLPSLDELETAETGPVATESSRGVAS